MSALIAGSVAFVAAPAAAADEVYSFPSSGSLQVLGKGFGHGHGMSQYGAKGRGEAGQSWTTITNFYYPGTTVATLPSSPIAVALTNAGKEGVAPPSPNRYQCDSALSGAADCGVALVPQTGLSYSELTSGTNHVLPATLGGKRVTTWGVGHRSDGTVLRVVGKTSDGSWVDYGPTDAKGFTFDRAGQTSVRFLDGTVSEYNGRIEVRRISTTRLIRLNVVYMESYLRGVVPREMPAGWDADAVRAQAVAARTYAAQERDANTWPNFDTCDSTSCQVYRGEKTTYPSGSVIQHESQSDAAITATAGKVRHYNGKPAFTQFSASNGGQMSQGGAPYLTFGADPYDKYPSWTSSLSRSQVQSAFPAIGTAQRVVITGRDGHGTWGGRVTTARLEGSAGSQSISGDRLRTLGGFKSSYLTLVRPDPHDRIGAAASGAAGAADVVSRLTTGAVVHRTWTEAGHLGSPVALGGGTSYAPGIARSAAGRLDVVVTGTDKHLWLRGRPAGSSSWSGWTDLGGSVNGRPAVVALANGYLDTFSRGTDGQIWERYRRPSGTWSGWIPLGGSVAAGTGAAAVETSDGTLTLVVHGTDGQGWSRSKDASGWSARWTALGGAIAGDPAAASDAPGKVSVVVRGTDNDGYVKELTNGVPDTDWTGIGGSLVASPAVFAVAGSDRLDVLANASGGTLMHASRTAGTWSAWAVAE